MKKKKKKLTKEDLKPENFKSQEENEEAVEEYLNSKPFYTVLNIFIGDAKVKKIKSDVDGKPPGY